MTIHVVEIGGIGAGSAGTRPDARRSRARLIGAVALVGLLIGCSSTPTVTRREVGEEIDLSGYWNDTDSRLVSEEMVNDCMSSPWSNKASAKFGRELEGVALAMLAIEQAAAEGNALVHAGSWETVAEGGPVMSSSSTRAAPTTAWTGSVLSLSRPSLATADKV